MGSPVFLTKNGRGRYAILDIKEYIAKELDNPSAAIIMITKIEAF